MNSEAFTCHQKAVTNKWINETTEAVGDIDIIMLSTRQQESRQTVQKQKNSPVIDNTVAAGLAVRRSSNRIRR